MVFRYGILSMGEKKTCLKEDTMKRISLIGCIVVLAACGGGHCDENGCVEGGDVTAHDFYVDNVTLQTAKPGCRVTLSANQTVSNATIELIEFDTEEYDHGDCWDTTNHRYTVKIPGVYSVKVGTYLVGLNDQDQHSIFLFLNGAFSTEAQKFAAVYNDGSNILVEVGLLLDEDDYLEARIYHTYGSDRTLDDATKYTYMQVQLVEGY